MPSVNADIKLQATGADEAVAQIEKLKAAFEKTAKQAQMLANSSANIGKALGSLQPAEVSQFLQNSAARHESGLSLYDRGRQEIERARSRGASGIAPRLAESSASTALSLARGDIGGAGSSMLGGIGGALSGAGIAGGIGAALAVGATAIKAISDLSRSEQGRINMIFSTGMQQRLGAGYMAIRDQIIGLGRTGVPLNMLYGLYNSMSENGFVMNKLNFGMVNTGSEMMARYGLNAGPLGKLFGLASMGYLDPTMLGSSFYSRGESTFGASSMNPYISESARMQESLYASGLSRADTSMDQFNANTGALASYASGGDLTPIGAVALNQRMFASGQASGSLQNPLDIVVLQSLMKDQHMSLTDAQAWMVNNPSAVNIMKYKYIKKTSPTEDVTRLRIGAAFGVNPADAIAVEKAMETPYVAPSSKMAHELRMSGEIANTSKDVSGTARGALALEQSDIFQGVSSTALGVINSIKSGLEHMVIGNVRLNAAYVTYEGIAGSDQSVANAGYKTPQALSSAFHYQQALGLGGLPSAGQMAQYQKMSAMQLFTQQIGDLNITNPDIAALSTTGSPQWQHVQQTMDLLVRALDAMKGAELPGSAVTYLAQISADIAEIKSVAHKENSTYTQSH